MYIIGFIIVLGNAAGIVFPLQLSYACNTFNLNKQFGAANVGNKVVFGQCRVVLLHVTGYGIDILLSLYIYAQGIVS